MQEECFPDYIGDTLLCNVGSVTLKRKVLPVNYKLLTPEPIHSPKRQTSKSNSDQVASHVCVERMREIVVMYLVGSLGI